MTRYRGYLRGRVHPVTLRYRARRDLDINNSAIISVRSDPKFPDDLLCLWPPRISLAIVVATAEGAVVARRVFELPARAFEADERLSPALTLLPVPAGDAEVSAALRDTWIPFPLESLYWEARYPRGRSDHHLLHGPIANSGEPKRNLVRTLTHFIGCVIDHNDHVSEACRNVIRVVVNITAHNNDQKFAIRNSRFFEKFNLKSKKLLVNRPYFFYFRRTLKNNPLNTVWLTRVNLFLSVSYLFFILSVVLRRFEKYLDLKFKNIS